MDRRRFLSGTSGTVFATAAGCLSSGEERTATIERDVREFLESDAAFSEEIAVLTASEVEAIEYHPGGVAVGVRHTLPFTASDDPEDVRDAVNTNSYGIAEAALATTDEILRIESNSSVASMAEDAAYEVSYVHLRWDTFDDVDWTAIEPADVPDVATRYHFDETAF
ncbi:hypothetical protein CV102_03820 [Natronococcus pandeyae]|uniref:Uncharacterized protein n=1 Tax=Natronococcus pandeyae TaxID=2055836 RepID=A0A8J8Q516_9EURY|nr:hypothetical protein [Natronococcus pandeyae]TYL39436.1 hypothetical protein CV102_03820 [Natronococcus pandeyae]